MINQNQVVSNAFIELGLPANVKGYLYAKDAVQMVLNDPTTAYQAVCEMYETIADNYSSTPESIERGIRYAVMSMWKNAPKEIINKYFGNTINHGSRHPSNSLFIFAVAYYIRENAQISVEIDSRT